MSLRFFACLCAHMRLHLSSKLARLVSAYPRLSLCRRAGVLVRACAQAILDPSAVRMYEVDYYLVRPWTVLSAASMAEVAEVAGMAEGEGASTAAQTQPCFWFVSHWWAQVRLSLVGAGWMPRPSRATSCLTFYPQPCRLVCGRVCKAKRERLLKGQDVRQEGRI
eukprot:3815400-Pleurochrysis_carterae.AAC.1